MQIVPEMDTVLNIGGSENTGKNNREDTAGFMGILMDANSKFSQMLKEDPRMVLAGLELNADEEAEGNDRVLAENLIMTAGWTDFMPGMANDMKSTAGSFIDVNADEGSGELMIGGKDGSLYGNLPVATGKRNPMMTGSRLLRSFGVARNPEMQNGEEIKPVMPEGDKADHVQLSREVAAAVRARMNESREAGIIEKGGEGNRNTGVNAKGTGTSETMMLSGDKDAAGKAGMIRILRTNTGTDSGNANSGNPGNASANRTVIRNAGRFVSELVRELNETNTGRATENTEAVKAADSSMVRELAEHVMKETMGSENPARRTEDIGNSDKGIEKNIPFREIRSELNGRIEKGRATEEAESVFSKGDVVKQLIEKVSMQKLEDGSSINVRLKPDSLGGITISLGMTAKGLTATIAATNPEVQGALAGSIDQLAAVLADYGINQDRIDVVPGEGYYGEQDANGFMFDDGNSNQEYYGKSGHNADNTETIEEESAELRRFGKDISIIDMYG